jgi:magnesium-transporting ATPase (P-type)
VKSEDLQVGMLIKVEDNYIIPADIVLLTSTNSRGIAFVDARNLEGEVSHLIH